MNSEMWTIVPFIANCCTWTILKGVSTLWIKYEYVWKGYLVKIITCVFFFLFTEDERIHSTDIQQSKTYMNDSVSFSNVLSEQYFPLYSSYQVCFEWRDCQGEKR